MRVKKYINYDWKYADEFEQEMISCSYNDCDMKTVQIPHTTAETPFNYFSDEIYQKVSAYRKKFIADPDWKNKRVFITFQGVAHEATVYLNGELLGTHSCGYTAFSFELTDKIKYKSENCIVVKLDSRESLNVPPFGFVVDYMTYGGIYRDVTLEITDKTYIEDIFAATEINCTRETYTNKKRKPMSRGAYLHIDTAIDGYITGCTYKISLKRLNGDLPTDYTDEYKDYKELISDNARNNMHFDYHTLPVVLWDIDNPCIYLLKTELFKYDELIDEKVTRIGFREALFTSEGFVLNGRLLKIRGLNRHQSYPYVGYAMPSSMQIEDARILKEELCVNAVRTSHYPQSQDFVDACDDKGLLVFMEFPGWQHIGDESWKEQALKNEKEMILQYRNHPSIIIWGIRINESADDDIFYKKTNALSHELDPYRQTGGVRAAAKMHLLEDVYTYNDFSHNGKKAGCQKKKTVTPDLNKGYLVTEYNGHMYPTKSFDDEEHRSEHAMRHVRVIDSIVGEKGVSGGFGWCMFDYNTHKDFGAGDRICYHGVMDMFRNPKMAAAVYVMQGDNEPVLELSSAMDIGERPECIRGDIWIFTNADSVKMYKNDVFIKEYTHDNSPYKNMNNPPLLVDDFIGELLAENEKFSKGFAEKVKHALNSAARYGLGGLGTRDIITGLSMFLFHRMSVKDIVDMYQKYIGDWGGQATSFRFEAIKDGKIVKTLVKETVSKVDIEIIKSAETLYTSRSYDVCAVRIKAVDQNGNVLPYFAESVKLKTEGAIELIGPGHVPLRGGMAGCYVKSVKGKETKGKLIIKTDGGLKIKKEVSFDLKEDKNA